MLYIKLYIYIFISPLFPLNTLFMHLLLGAIKGKLPVRILSWFFFSLFFAGVKLRYKYLCVWGDGRGQRHFFPPLYTEFAFTTFNYC